MLLWVALPLRRARASPPVEVGEGASVCTCESAQKVMQCPEEASCEAIVRGPPPPLRSRADSQVILVGRAGERALARWRLRGQAWPGAKKPVWRSAPRCDAATSDALRVAVDNQSPARGESSDLPCRPSCRWGLATRRSAQRWRPGRRRARGAKHGLAGPVARARAPASGAAVQRAWWPRRGRPHARSLERIPARQAIAALQRVHAARRQTGRARTACGARTPRFRRPPRWRRLCPSARVCFCERRVQAYECQEGQALAPLRASAARSHHGQVARGEQARVQLQHDLLSSGASERRIAARKRACNARELVSATQRVASPPRRRETPRSPRRKWPRRRMHLRWARAMRGGGGGRVRGMEVREAAREEKVAGIAGPTLSDSQRSAIKRSIPAPAALLAPCRTRAAHLSLAACFDSMPYGYCLCLAALVRPGAFPPHAGLCMRAAQFSPPAAV